MCVVSSLDKAVRQVVLRALLLLLTGGATWCALPQRAHAVPSFARKYHTSCVTCHTVYPFLNPFGEAFRRNGFRFPSHQGSLDSDSVRAEVLALGQEQYKKLFPNAVWPDSITADVPLSLVANASAAVNLPESGARADAGNTFAWNDFVGELALFGAGSFDDWLTYFVELSIAEGGAEIEHAYVVWCDLFAPHLLDLLVGRLAPTLTSFGPHSSYLSDMLLPSPALAALYNANAPDGPIGTAYGHPDGIELRGIAGHRVNFSAGWVASGASGGLGLPTSGDLYAHVGGKVGGMTLDGEGPSGAMVSDPSRPFAETAATVDVFGYRGVGRADNGLGVDGPSPQTDYTAALGGTVRLQLQAFVATLGLLVERHSAPYAAVPATAQAGAPLTADRHSAVGVIQFNELAYVAFPWLVPAVRSEWTHLTLDGQHGGDAASILRLVAGVSALFRPNVKFALAVEIERATGMPPAMTWAAAGAYIAAVPGERGIEAERLRFDLSWGF